MPTDVSPRFLLEGAAYALEQAGLLLRDATLLHDNGSHATSVVLAALAGEELGRWQILLELRERVLDGETLTLDQVKDACDDHVVKQAKGVRGITTKFNADQGLGKLIRAKWEAERGTKEREELTKQLDKISRQQQRRAPHDRHADRMAALYVGPKLNSEWNRPASAIGKVQAREILEDVIGSYAIIYEQEYITESGAVLKDTNLELFDAFDAWAERPVLPIWRWPSLSV
jgi:AbiV family abortive infection protein